MYKLDQIKLNINHSISDFRKKIAKLAFAKVDNIDWSKLIILHKSIDARDKKNILYVYNVAFDFIDNDSKSHKKVKLEKYIKCEFNPIVKTNNNVLKRPIVVGFGPAGIFASYILSLNGMRPIIVERGKMLDDRIKDVENFFDTMKLDENSNVCFGEGGAGAFSDGKLNTNNKDKYGVYNFVLKTFIKFGADEKILYENLPHIGTDKLVDVIKNIRNEIIKLGGEIHFNTKFSIENGVGKIIDLKANEKKLNGEETYDKIIHDGTPVILAIGNSSRDTFYELINNKFNICAKTIAVGYRIAHKQTFINDSQYGDYSKNNKVSLPPANYKLVCNIEDKSVYSFCMCPGGYIINSSNFNGKLSINGMSYNDRNGLYANSAIVVPITPQDLIGGDISDPKCMIKFQEIVEKKAYDIENGYIPYNTYGSSDINEDDIFKGKSKKSNTLLSIYNDCGLKFDVNEYIEKAIKQFDRYISGFSENKCVIAGVETRTSSPVKLDRNENCMCNIDGYFPCGEGLGHGGGIMSSAVDGINVAMKILDLYK